MNFKLLSTHFCRALITRPASGSSLVELLIGRSLYAQKLSRRHGKASNYGTEQAPTQLTSDLMSTLFPILLSLSRLVRPGVVLWMCYIIVNQHSLENQLRSCKSEISLSAQLNGTKTLQSARYTHTTTTTTNIHIEQFPTESITC